MADMQLLTNSRARDARLCLRLHQIKYLRGYRPLVTAEPLRFGHLVHVGLEAWWRADQGDARLAAALSALAGEQADPFDQAKAHALIHGYHVRWKDEPFDVLAVELEFRLPLVNPATGGKSTAYRLGGKIDAIVRDQRDGRILIVEHKTTSENITSGSEYWKRLRMDGQISTYYDGARAAGFDVSACLYDVISKPGIRPLKVNQKRKIDETPIEYATRVVDDIAADPAAYFARGEVVRLEAEILDHQYDLWQLAAQIRESTNAGRFPKNPDACVQYGRTCPYFSVCTGEASLDDPSLFSQSADVHPELSALPTTGERGAEQ